MWKKEMTMEKQLVDKEPEFYPATYHFEEALFKYEEKRDKFTSLPKMIICVGRKMIEEEYLCLVYERRFVGWSMDI
jgi:hypothetical protein